MSSSSTPNVLQEQQDKFDKLASNELGKGKGCDEGLLAQNEKRVDSLIAQIKLMPSGEVQMRSVLCC